MADAPRGEGAAPRAAPSILPLSGIGVDGPHLVIAPPGNPRIQLDARLLDRVALVGRSPRSAIAMSAGAGLGAVAGAAGLLWGGVITALGLGLVAVDRAFESRRRVRNRELLLSLGNLDVALHVADGAAAAADLEARLAPYTRAAPITTVEAYEDARRRLAAAGEGRAPGSATRLAGTLTVGPDDVTVRDGVLVVGDAAFTIDAVREQALRGANLVLPGGRLVQAAVGLLVVAAADRARAGEDLEALSQRVATYEAWSGRAAGR